jgi:hypothetical protein
MVSPILLKRKVRSQLGASSGMIEVWFHNVLNLLFSFQQLRVLVLSITPDEKFQVHVMISSSNLCIAILVVFSCITICIDKFSR